MENSSLWPVKKALFQWSLTMPDFTLTLTPLQKHFILFRTGEPKIAITHIQNKLDSVTPGQEISLQVWSSCTMCLTSPSLYSTPALLSYNWTFWTQGSQNSRGSLLFVNTVNTLRSSWTDWIASSLSFSLPLKWEMGLNSYSCKCRNQSFFPVTRPAPTSSPFTFSPRNVNCCGALSLKSWFSCESAAALGYMGYRVQWAMLPWIQPNNWLCSADYWGTLQMNAISHWETQPLAALDCTLSLNG